MPPALLVDDDVQLLESVKAVAKLGKLDLVTAASWDEGLALFQVLSPELVIADYNMPGSRHGLSLLHRIRQLRPSVRLILISGYLDEDDMEQVLRLGVADRAMTKGTAVDTASEIVREIQAITSKTHAPTDWVEYSNAHLRASEISDDVLDELDTLLRKKLPDDTDGR